MTRIRSVLTLALAFVLQLLGLPLQADNPPCKDESRPPLFPFLGESTGMRFRRVALNGLPLPDARGQTKPESGQANEESYVDSLTRRLRHDTSDIYVALPGGELALAVKRSVGGELWSHDKKGFYGEHPSTHIDLDSPNTVKPCIDRPFGMGWTSGIGACLRIESYVIVAQNPNPERCPPPPRGYVLAVDENGGAYRYHRLPGAPSQTEEAKPIFVPLPTDRSERNPFVDKLVAVPGSSGIEKYVLTRKYGTKVTYSGTPTVTKTLELEVNCVTKHVRYYRLDEVEDRFGNKLKYNYTGSSLIPDTIQAICPGCTTRTLAINHTEGLVRTITDPRGKIWTYNYKSPVLTLDGIALPLLESVTAPQEISKTTYTYGDFSSSGVEDSDKPKSAGNLASPDKFFYLNLTKIKSNDGKYLNRSGTLTNWPASQIQETVFEYDFDYTVSVPVTVKQGSDYENQSYDPYLTRPRIIKKIILPDGTFTTFAKTGTNTITLEQPINVTTGQPKYDGPNGPSVTGGKRMSVVTDAKGKEWKYTYDNAFLEFIRDKTIETDLVSSGEDPRPPFMMIAWNECTLTYPDNTVETATFDSVAAGVDALITDYSGSQTKYNYDEDNTPASRPRTFSSNQPAYLDSTLAGKLDTLNLISGEYDDPVTEITAYNTSNAVTRIFTYTTSRFLEKIVVNKGGIDVRTVTYEVEDSPVSRTGNRTQETIEDNTTPAVEKFYEYHPQIKSFVTSETIPDANHVGATLTTDLVAWFTPDEYGNVHQKISSDLWLTTEHEYDANNNLTKTVDPRGSITRFAYDAINRLISTTLPDLNGGVVGSVILGWGWSPNGMKIWEKDGEGHYTFFEYDKGSRRNKTIRDMNDAGDVFDPPDEVDIVTSAVYNGVGKTESQTDAKGTITEFAYDALHRLTTVTFDPGDLNLVTTYEYDPAKKRGSGAFITDGFKPTKVTDPEGYSTWYTYDELYRPVNTWKQISKSPVTYQATKTTYDAFGNATRTMASRTPHTSPAGDPSPADSLGNSATYDSQSRPVDVTENIFGGGDDSTYSATIHNDYTATSLWRTTKTIGSMTWVTETDYDFAGRPVKIWHPSAFDGTANRSYESDLVAGSGATVIVYDNNGNRTGIRDTVQNWTRTTFDYWNRPTHVGVNSTSGDPAVDPRFPAPSDDVTVTTYDNNGNVRYFQDARNNTWETVYDHANRPTDKYTPVVENYLAGSVRLHTVTEYDKNGNARYVTDPVGALTDNYYDNANRLVATYLDPLGANVYSIHDYDNVGNLTLVIDGNGRETAFTYDGLKRKLTTKWDAQDPGLCKTDTISYDALLLTGTTDAKLQQISYNYDGHRPTGLTCVGAPSQSRTYVLDTAGRVNEIYHGGSNSVGGDIRNVRMDLDYLDRVVTETSGGLVHDTGFDKNGNVLSKGYGTGLYIYYYNDRRNRPEEMYEAQGITSYIYDGNSNVTRISHDSFGNAFTEYFTFDDINRLRYRDVTTGSGYSPVSQSSWMYDKASNLAFMNEIGDSAGGTIPRRYVTNTYDYARRLETETVTFPTSLDSVVTTYYYDNANNRTGKYLNTTISGSNTTEWHSYEYGTNGKNANQLYRWTKPGGATVVYEYDANGNRSTKTQGSVVDTYSYDYFNRLTQVQHDPGGSGTTTSDYQYDHRTRRVTRSEPTTGGGTLLTTVSYSGGTSVMEYETSSANPTVQFVRGVDKGGGVGGLLYSIRGSNVSWALSNGRGDIVGRCDENGNISYAASYEAFGTRTAENGINDDRQRANTKEEDPTGLLNEGYRYRDLATGVFITRDPAGFVDGPNVYTYVRQNPWSKFDPMGLSEQETRELVNQTFNSWGFVGTVGRWLRLDDALTSSLNTADERMTANAAAGRGRTLSTREYVGGIAEGAAPAAKVVVVATGVAAVPTVTGLIITRPIASTAIAGATAETIAGVEGGYVSPTSVVQHAPNLRPTIGVLEESARRISSATQVAKGLSVIGPRATYREFAKKLGAKFLDVTDEAWDWAQNEKFLMEIVQRGDDVVFAGKFNPARLDPNSILAKEINYLIERGYGWTDDFAKLIKK